MTGLKYTLITAHLSTTHDEYGLHSLFLHKYKDIAVFRDPDLGQSFAASPYAPSNLLLQYTL